MDASIDETSNAAPLGSAGDAAPSPKSEASVKSRDGGDSPLEDEPGRATSSQRSRAPARTLVLKGGHSECVRCLAGVDLPTGGWLASSSIDEMDRVTIIIWNLADGKQIAKLGSHMHKHWPKYLVALDGCRLASGSEHGGTIIWNFADEKQIANFVGPVTGVVEVRTGVVTCLAALDSDRLASAGGFGEIIPIFSVADGKKLAELKGHTDEVWNLAALDGDRLASSGGEEIIIWNHVDGTQLTKLDGGGDLAVFDGDRLVSNGGDGLIFWNLADGTQLAKLEGHASLGSAMFDGGRSADIDRAGITIRSVADGKQLATFRGHGAYGGEWCLAALDGYRLASGDEDGTIRVRPVLHSSAYKFAAGGSALEFEEIARECRGNFCLGDLVDVTVQQSDEKLVKLSVDNEITTQAQVFDAIAKVVNEEEDAPRKKSIDSLAPSVLGLVHDGDLLPIMNRRGIKNKAIEQVASTALFRVILDAKFAAGPRLVLYCEVFLYLALMFCFARVAGYEILGWPKWYPTEKIVLLFFGFAILAWFSAREVGQMASARAIELAEPEDPLDEARGLAGWALLVPRLLVGFVVGLLLLPLLLACCCCCFCGRPEYGEVICGDERKSNNDGSWFGRNIFKPILHDPLTFLGVPRAWRTDYWNAIDVAAIACTLASFVLAAMPNRRLYPNLAAFTALLLWIRLCGFLKLADVKLAAFVLMFEKIMYDIRVFMFFLLVILLMFASALLFILGPRERHGFTFPKTLYELYLLVITGDSQLDFDSAALRVLLFLILFVVVIVLLNVLITIVGNSHEESEKTAAGLFYRSRLDYIVETAPFGTPIVKHLKQKARGRPDVYSDVLFRLSIKKRLADALKQHEEDASEADTDAQLNTKRALRESAEKIAAIEEKLNAILEKLK